MDLFKLVGTLAIEGVDKANSELDGVGKKAQSTESGLVSTFKKIGAAAATFFAVDKIKDFGVKIVQTAADVQAQKAQFESAFGDMKNSATDMFDRVSESTGVFATRLQTAGTKAYSQFKGAGIDANDALKNTETFLGLASDAAAYYDISLEDAEARIRSFLRGNVEAGDAIGLFTSESQRNEYAVEMYGKKWIKLTEAQKQNVMLNVAETIYKQSGATGQAARESDGLANVVGNLKEVWRQFLAVVGEPALKLVTPIIQNLSTWVETLKQKVEDLQGWIALNGDTVEKWKEKLESATGIVAGLASALGAAKIINNISNGFKLARQALEQYIIQLWACNSAGLISTATLSTKNIVLNMLTGNIGLTTGATMLWQKAQSALNKTFLASPITWVVLAIAGLVAGLVVAYKKSESFRAVVDKLFAKLKELWGVIQNELKAAFAEIKPAVDGVIDALRDLWNTISSALAPIIDWLVAKIKQYMPLIKALVKNAISNIATAIKNLLVVIKTVFNIITITIKTALNVIKNVIKLFTAVLKGDWKGAWEAIKNIFKSVWNGIKSIAKTTLSGLKNIFTNTWNNIKSATSRTWNGIRDSVTKPVREAMDKVKGYIDKIKGFFTNFKAKMKMPHIKIKNASWNPKDWIKNGIPKFSVEWYKEGGILTEPTAFGYNPVSGAVRVGGEAGKEAVAPIDLLMGYVQTAVKAETNGLATRLDVLLDILAKFFPEILEAANKAIVLDDGTVVGKLAPKMNQKLGEIQTANARGR